MKELFNERPMLAYRRDKNSCDMLVHKKTAKLVCLPKSRCECKVCQALHEGEVFDVAGKQRYKPVQDPACSLQNVVYALVLLCRQCEKTIYVGETGRSVTERISEHLRDVKNQAEKPIMRHFKGHIKGGRRQFCSFTEYRW